MTPNTLRPRKREMKTAVVPAAAMPFAVQRKNSHKYWDDDECLTGDTCALIALETDGEEFDSVRSHFLASFGGQVVTSIQSSPPIKKTGILS